MNRLFFRPEQSGMTKTDAAAQTLSNINPDVQIESYSMNITTIAGFDEFKASICGQTGKSRVDMVLSCVDNYEARMTINQASSCISNPVIGCMSRAVVTSYCQEQLSCNVVMGLLSQSSSGSSRHAALSVRGTGYHWLEAGLPSEQMQSRMPDGVDFSFALSISCFMCYRSMWQCATK